MINFVIRSFSFCLLLFQVFETTARSIYIIKINTNNPLLTISSKYLSRFLQCPKDHRGLGSHDHRMNEINGKVGPLFIPIHTSSRIPVPTFILHEKGDIDLYS